MMQQGLFRVPLIALGATISRVRVGPCEPRVYDARECYSGLFSIACVRTIVLRTLKELRWAFVTQQPR